MTHTCPTVEELRSLVDGSLSDIEAQPLELHIDRCEACQRALQELAADGAFWTSAATSLSDDKIVGPGLDRVIETLHQQSREDAEDIGEAIELKLSFIEPPTEPGTIGRLRHYDILRVAGRGGMGIVVKAFDRSLRRVVAIKLLAPHLAGNGQARQRFVREGRAAAAICHQHVVTIHAVEESPPFLVMQYVHGETLEARIHRNGSLDVREAVRIALQIAQGLAAAHAQGVVHRDIKPANILLENGVARVRITDFGLARAIDDASLTQSGVVAGTPQYMAPEQASGDAIDERADLFSLGSVLYTMLAGHAPFRATTAMGVLKRLCDNAPRPIREINPETPDWLVVLINRLHAKRPADRFHNAADVAALLERGLAAMQNGTAMPVPFAPGQNAVEARNVPDEESTQAVHGVPETVVVQRNGTTKVSSEGRGGELRSFLKRWLPPYPLWLLFAGVGLMVTPFVRQAGILGATFAMIAFLTPRLMPGFTARLLNHAGASANPDTESPPQRFGLVFRQQSFLPVGWLQLAVWIVLWILPSMIWKQVFFYEEYEALSGSSNRLFRANAEILGAAALVFAAWLLIGVLWFRRKHNDGSAVFAAPVRRKGLLTVAGLAAIFCACGYGTWYSDVYHLAESRIVMQNPGSPMPSDNEQQQFQVRVDFQQAIEGTSVIIDGDSGPQYYYPPFNSAPPSGFVGRAANYPWRALLGQVTVSSGEVTFNRGQVAVIQVPRPRLIDLIAGRWKSKPKTVMTYADTESPQSSSIEFEFNKETAILVDRSSNSSSRMDLKFQIDESVTPALITFTGSHGEALVGIIRFEPHPGDQWLQAGGMGSNMGSSMRMGGPGAAGSMMGGSGTSEDSPLGNNRLLICISQGGFLRPWQFQSDPEHGISLFELIRSPEPESLQSSLALEPLPTGTSANVVRESVQAWSKRLQVLFERRNSIGLDLTLVPPAHFDLPLSTELRAQRILLPESQTVVNENPETASSSVSQSPGSVPPSAESQQIVAYPFVISRDLISMSQFQQFVDATGYVTDAERGEPQTNAGPLAASSPPAESAAPPDAGVLVEDTPETEQAAKTFIGGWQRRDSKFVWIDGLTWKTPRPESSIAEGDPSSSGASGQSPTATVLSLRDAMEFCQWLSTKENRQYRLPTAQEWNVAIQLGAVRHNLKRDPEEFMEYRPWFDADEPNPLGIRTPKHIFGEWTADSEWMLDKATHVIVHKDFSSDGQRFDLSHKYIAPMPFRSSEISFRVVAELQTLAPPDVNALPGEQQLH